MSKFITAAQKEGENHGWMYLLGVLISFLAGQILGAIPLFITILQKGQFSIDIISNPEKLGVDKNKFLCMMLLPFVVSFIVLWLFIKYIHKKRILVSITAFEKFSYNKFWFSFLVWFLMSGIFDLIFYALNPQDYAFTGFHFPSFFILLLISLTLIPIQTSYEELLFRSYLMQGIGMLFPKRIIPLIITSIVFGLLHIANPEITAFGNLVLIQYIAMGFLLGMLTLLSDSMELSLGLHAANNIYACLIMSFEHAALSTDTLFQAKNMKVNMTTILVFIVILTIYYFIIQKKYKMLPIKDLFEKF
jgi:uncharacterized protein